MSVPYPQSPYAPPPPAPTPAPAPADPGRVPRLLAAILGLLAAALVVVGSFLPQTSFEQVVNGKTDTKQSISAWTRTFDVAPGDEAKKFYDRTHVARYGIPLTTGAVVLLAGVGLAFAGARRSSGQGVRSGARTALIAGGAGVAAAVWMLGMDVSATLSYESDEGEYRTHYATGLGFWLLLGGGALAVVVLVLAALAGRRGSTAASPPRYPQPFATQPGSGYYNAPGQQPPYGNPAGQQYGVPAPGPSSQPFPAQGPGPYGGPSSQPFPAQPPSPTEPNYQLPPLDPPKT